MTNNTNSSRASKPKKPLQHWSPLLSGLKYFGSIAEQSQLHESGWHLLLKKEQDTAPRSKSQQARSNSQSVLSASSSLPAVFTCSNRAEMSMNHLWSLQVDVGVVKGLKEQVMMRGSSSDTLHLQFKQTNKGG